MAKTLGEQLTSVQAAISAVENNQEYTIGDKTFKKANLSTLYKREDDLLSKIAQHGPDYIPGAAKPAARRAHVSFSL